METVASYVEKSYNCTMHSQWLHATLSGVNEKMKEIMNLLEENDLSPPKKEAITQILDDICTSYASLAKDYALLKSCTISELTSNSELASSNEHDVPKSDENWDGSGPESTVEDPEVENEDDANKTTADNLLNDESRAIKSEKGVFDTMCMYSKIVEESARFQMELIRRNSEKREMILDLRDRVVSLTAEKDALLRKLSYYERNVQVVPPTKRNIRAKFFGCS